MASFTSPRRDRFQLSANRYTIDHMSIPLSYILLKNALLAIDETIMKLGIAKGKKLKIVIAGTASAILAYGEESADKSTGQVCVMTADTDEQRIFEIAQRTATSKYNAARVFMTTPPLLHDANELKKLYTESLEGPCILMGQHLAVYAADWEFQVARSIREATKPYLELPMLGNRDFDSLKGDVKLREAYSIISYVVRLREGVPVVLPFTANCGVPLKYADQAELTENNARYIQAAFGGLAKISVPAVHLIDIPGW